MFERLKMLMRVACLYVKRQKRLDLLKQIKASGFSAEVRDRVIHIMRRMRIIREADLQASDASEALSFSPSSSASKSQRENTGERCEAATEGCEPEP